MNNEQSNKIDIADKLLETSFDSVVGIVTLNDDIIKRKYLIDTVYKYSFLGIEITKASYIIVDNSKTEKIVLFIDEINYMNTFMKLYSKHFEPQIFINNSHIQKNKTETMIWLYGEQKKGTFNKNDVNEYILSIWEMDSVRVSLYKANTVFNKNNSVMIVIDSTGKSVLN